MGRYCPSARYCILMQHLITPRQRQDIYFFLLTIKIIRDIKSGWTHWYSSGLLPSKCRSQFVHSLMERVKKKFPRRSLENSLNTQYFFYLLVGEKYAMQAWIWYVSTECLYNKWTSYLMRSNKHHIGSCIKVLHVGVWEGIKVLHIFNAFITQADLWV